MFQTLPPLKSLVAFEAAARHSSFSVAAGELSLTQGAISYQVKQLESSLGLILFRRRARKVTLTDSGNRLYLTVHRLLSELDDELKRIVPRPNNQVLTVSVSTYFVTRWLTKKLGNFINTNPDITIRLQHSVNDPDFNLDEVDLAIRWGNGIWPGYQAESLVDMPMIAVCAPGLIQGDDLHTDPATIRELPLLHDQPGMDQWSAWLQQAGVDSTSLTNGPVIVDPNVRVQSAIDGLGMVLANPLVQPELDNGTLVEPFAVRLVGMGYHLVYKPSAIETEAFKVFRRWLFSEATD